MEASPQPIAKERSWGSEDTSAAPEPARSDSPQVSDEIDLSSSALRPETWARPALSRLRWQIPLMFGLAAVVPGLLIGDNSFWLVHKGSSSANTFVVASFCSMIALLLFRRLEQFPGVTSFVQIAPSVLASYGFGLALIFVLRIDYSRPFALLSVASALLLLGALWVYYRRKCVPTVYLLPGAELSSAHRMKVQPLTSTSERIDRNSIIAADLQADLAPGWERFILHAALAGIPVFNAKALQESATGKVEIAHLSENTFGSVLPSRAYLSVKRWVDITLAVLAMPLLAPLIALIALAIKLDSRGSVFFRQERMGFRQQPFVMFKFRTMHDRLHVGDHAERIKDAMTQDEDKRITRVGRFLRRHRVDELPQVLNILKGEMSWIGPRPEAELLSKWYDHQIPFYGYRHVVRPGISGWAQVNQGHVVNVGDVKDKLYFDFYYIKHFSAWLDVLIAARTLKILLLGSGAK